MTASGSYHEAQHLLEQLDRRPSLTALQRANVHLQLAIVDTQTGSAQIRRYVSLKDNSTNDGSFFFMQ